MSFAIPIVVRDSTVTEFRDRNQPIVGFFFSLYYFYIAAECVSMGARRISHIRLRCLHHHRLDTSHTYRSVVLLSLILFRRRKTCPIVSHMIEQLCRSLVLPPSLLDLPIRGSLGSSLGAQEESVTVRVCITVHYDIYGTSQTLY